MKYLVVDPIVVNTVSNRIDELENANLAEEEVVNTSFLQDDTKPPKSEINSIS